MSRLLVTVLCFVSCFKFVRLYHKLTWSDIVNLQVSPRNIKWGQNGKFVYYKDINNNIISQSLIEDQNGNKEQKTILDKIYWKDFDDFDLTGPANIIILVKNKQKDRHIQYVDLYKFVLEQRATNKEVELFLENVQCWEILSHPTKDRLVFVKEWNIYIQELGPQMKTTKQIGSRTGSAMKPRGVLPWLYSEEFFGTSKGFWQSPNGDYLLFMESDETYVNKDTINIIVGASSNEQKQITYPKPNTPNPTVLLKMYHVELAQLIVGADKYLNPAGQNYKHYIVSVSFPSSTKVLVEFMNRQQTRSVTEACSMSMSPECHNLENLRRESYKSWLDRYPTSGFLTSSGADNVYYTLRPVMAKGSNYTHIHRDISQSARNKLSLTNGEYDVTEIVGTDYTHTRVYYISTEHGPHTQHLYVLNTKHKNKKTCISCTQPACTWVKCKMSPKNHMISMICKGPGPPNRTFFINTKTSKVAHVLRSIPDNQLKSQNSVKIKFMKVRVGKLKFYVKMFVPTNFDSNRKYPLVVNVYGGPTKVKVNTKYQVLLQHYLASRYQSIVLFIDARGTPGRGHAFRDPIYKNFGNIEVHDTVKVIKVIARQKYINENRIGIYGASYGGYFVLRALELYPKLFKAGVSIAPVTDWRFYDTAYTERYMGLYDKKIYDRSSTINHSHTMPNRKLLIIHGLEDDNVLAFQTFVISKFLLIHRKDFIHQFRPGETHNVHYLVPLLRFLRKTLYGICHD